MATSVSPRLRGYLEEYAETHHTPVNQALHFLGIPILIIASLGLLSKIAPARRPKSALRPNGAWPVVFGTGTWYALQGRKIGPAASAMLLAGYAVGSALPGRTLVGLFGVGAIAHAVGHYEFEHRPPSFLSKPWAVFEAPLWLVARWSGIYP